MTEPFRSPRHQREILLADWQDGELLAAHHMRTTLAFADAFVTPGGVDAGIDVVATGAAAQVKHYGGKAVGAPEVQMVRGAAHAIEHVLFYSLSGYTSPAIAAGTSANVALFRYTIYGDVAPTNRLAESLVKASEAARQALTRPDPEYDSIAEGVAAWWRGLRR